MSPLNLDLGFRLGEWSAARPGCFVPWKKFRVATRKGNLVGSRCGLIVFETMSFFLPAIEPRFLVRPARSLVSNKLSVLHLQG
jgi:hypothetical protein